METPFSYGTTVDGKDFVNRKQELARLHDNFQNGINTMLISPRRWGKTSLVMQAAKTFKGKDHRFVFLDLFNVHSEKDFYRRYAEAVLTATSNKMEEGMNSVREFFSHLVPQVSFSPDQVSRISFGLDWNGDPPFDEVLDLPERIAKKKGINIVVCIDEFQNLNHYNEPLAFQRRLRAHWQQHREVRYLLYGSKRHLLNEFFNSASMPFYRFGDIMFLDRIEEEEWTKFVQRRFRLTDKQIDKSLAKEIPKRMACHSYFVQQLAYYVWLNTERSSTPESLEKATEQLLQHNQMFYLRLVEDLSSTQINFLKALTDGVEKLSAADVLHAYELGSSANVVKIKSALENKEIIDNWKGRPEFTDPAFALWFKTIYMERA